MPEWVQERTIAAPFTFGAIGGYVSTRILNITLRVLLSSHISNFENEKLPVLENMCRAAMWVVPAAVAVFEPKVAHDVLVNHPSYFAGFAGVYGGGSFAVWQDNKKAKNRLEKASVKKTPPIELNNQS